MDESQFDDLTKTFALPSRRGDFSAMGAAVPGAL